MEFYDSVIGNGTHRAARARISVVPAQHSWVALPGPFVSSLQGMEVQRPLVIRLTVTSASAFARTASAYPRQQQQQASSRPASSAAPRYVAWSGDECPPGTIQLSAGLAGVLQLPAGTEVLLEALPRLAAAAAVVVEPASAADWEVVELNAGLLEDMLLSQAGVVCVGQPFPLGGDGSSYVMKSSGSSSAAGPAGPVVTSWMTTSVFVSAATAKDLNLKPALQSCLARLGPRLSLTSWRAFQSAELPLPGGLLLVGGSDGGRGWLLQLLGQAAAQQYGAHVLQVSCKGLAGQSYDAAAAVLAAAAAEAAWCCPGLLLLDDLELLTPAATGEGGHEQDQATAARLSEWLADLMHWTAQQPRPLAFAATCSSAAALPAALRSAGCLDCEVKVPPFGVQGRAALLLAGLKAKGMGFSGGVQEVEGLAGKDLEGFDAKDLRLVVDRAVHAALRRHMAAGNAAAAAAGVAAAGLAGTGSSLQLQQQQQQQQPLAVSAEDVASALAGFVPAAFWRAGQQKGQQQQEGGIQGWEDVGGLSDAVAALHEALVMPAKYGQLLAAAPLRLRTGLLLFGPPGCGKTHVVAAAVAATGARLISVKGPELLNKYIGQSEAAVRELFARAAAAAPCVLFFDEFDAIAPPRGHDSTGVTDRVVNQLLTELDGVEGLSGVAVLAATSRPDLIDAALLRPGRLDRMVYCGFPDAAERLAILGACARKLPVAADVDFGAVAQLTANFTGADMAAVLSEAQLLAVHEQLDKAQQQQQQQQQQQEGATEGSSLAPVLRMEHLQRALARSRPSLPAAEQRRLAAVYGRFQQSRDPGLSNRTLLDEQQQRVKHATLA
ncbi:hypothetical protein OEZ86_010771 [Tetradesmus obliquus]|nr:hypothetical protein OEZ86_010771 [Tetradesmus obliquus]